MKNVKHLTAMILGAASAALILASGCGGRIQCGPGTIERDGQCVVAEEELVTECGPGTVKDGATCRSLATSEDTGETCTPDCSGKECGDDGCGGVCDYCADDAEPFCDLETYTCVALECVPACPPDWRCGDDGCGGTCGECPTEAPFCSPDHACVEECVPDCDGRACGGDGCGGTCGGQCAGGESCNEGGQCVPAGWLCAPSAYGDGNICDCACGAIDPDCGDSPDFAANCGPYQTCDARGECADKRPAEWTCAPERYQDSFYCDCECGAPDPDCEDVQLPVSGCLGDTSCNLDGTCGVCTPDCDGRECGGDGCGGSCGLCEDATLPFCSATGACVGQCDPVPAVCAINECGDDGCGGSCGTCADGAACVAGACVAEQDPSSCDGICGQVAPDGCSCQDGCEEVGDCCADYVDSCDTCVPDCTGRVCGDDGCGGACGTCADAILSACDDASGQCYDPMCVPICDGMTCGDDGCGGSCGTCAAGLSCFALSQNCAPPEWICEPSAYGDGLACDCGCGAPDPDCAGGAAMVNNCPMGASCDMMTGSCLTTSCLTDFDCGQGELCEGAYWRSGRRFTGACVARTPTMIGMAGSACVTNTDCDSGLCDLGTCRAHCRTEMDCLSSGELCVGIEPPETYYLTLDAVVAPGWVSVCAAPPGDLTSCASDADCLEPGEVCAALVDGESLTPRYQCTRPDPTFLNAVCGISPQCTMDLQCAPTSDPLAPVCARACPGGQADCPVNETCTSILFNDQNTASGSDDVSIAVCIP